MKATSKAQSRFDRDPGARVRNPLTRAAEPFSGDQQQHLFEAGASERRIPLQADTLFSAASDEDSDEIDCAFVSSDNGGDVLDKNKTLRFREPDLHDEVQQQDNVDALSSISATTTMNDTERQLEDLQVRTVFSLVEAIPVELDGSQVTKRLLYLTNSQTRKFPFGDMQKVLQAMEVTQPKLIINLFGSIAHNYSLCIATSSVHWSKPESSTLHYHDYAEVNEKELRETDKRIAMFLEACILPLAIQTNALVICDNDDCSFSKAFSEICIAEANKRHGVLPFTVMVSQL
jgi:hypothetical protein